MSSCPQCQVEERGEEEKKSIAIRTFNSHLENCVSVNVLKLILSAVLWPWRQNPLTQYHVLNAQWKHPAHKVLSLRFRFGLFSSINLFLIFYLNEGNIRFAWASCPDPGDSGPESKLPLELQEPSLSINDTLVLTQADTFPSSLLDHADCCHLLKALTWSSFQLHNNTSLQSASFSVCSARFLCQILAVLKPPLPAWRNRGFLHLLHLQTVHFMRTKTTNRQTDSSLKKAAGGKGKHNERERGRQDVSLRAAERMRGRPRCKMSCRERRLASCWRCKHRRPRSVGWSGFVRKCCLSFLFFSNVVVKWWDGGRWYHVTSVCGSNMSPDRGKSEWGERPFRQEVLEGNQAGLGGAACPEGFWVINHVADLYCMWHCIWFLF